MPFVWKPLQSDSFFRTFHIFLPMLSNLLGSWVLYFPILLHYSQDTFLSLPLLKSHFPDCLFFIKIICLISSWLISILRVSSNVTHFFLPIMLLLELSQLLLCYLTVLTHFKKTLTFSVLPGGYQMSHLLFDDRRRECVFCKLHFFFVWSRPPLCQ